ncbi:MAG: AMP-binding protein, partial [Leptolyngbyaceae cyanobacterium SM1_3_5]|nr:AMP-binding protein [Leptolyngbyaceae cyanobacterium SM1_3_5]
RVVTSRVLYSSSFTQRAQQIQAQLWQDLDHRDVSGVEVLRQLARSQQRITSALMPVVFTSILMSEQKSDRLPWQSEVVYSLSQTSQVYLDHQVAEVDRALVFNWDAIDDLFPPGVLDEMFAAYGRLLDRLADDPACWNATSLIAPSANWSAFNATETEFPDALLHTLVFDRIAAQPDRIAVIAPQRSLTYRELGDRALRLGSHLHRQGICPNQLVAVVMQKGWEQIVAVLGVLAAGAAYVPIDPDLPIDRLHHLLAQTEFVLTQSWLDLQTDLPRLCVDTAELEEAIDLPAALPTDLAYVIYTSGSTGLPKGVMIEHRSAVNTILDINRRFDVTERDRVLALSSLSFDLSVYDIFGILAAGGAIVLPDPSLGNDPAHWRHLIAQHHVTVWNSVPALMQLLVEQSIDSDLRLVMLSGDWIPLNLPDRIRTCFPNAEIISLGGATEAAIWSIFMRSPPFHQTNQHSIGLRSNLLSPPPQNWGTSEPQSPPLVGDLGAQRLKPK